MIFDPEIFGKAFHDFVQSEAKLFGSLAIFFHIATLIILFLVWKYGNRYRKLYSFYFSFNWLFLFGYWGVYGIFYWYKIGILYLISFVFAPILLGLILFGWIKEVVGPKIDLDFSKTKKWRFWILLFLLWGFWYPTYFYGQGFVFHIKDFLFSFYGLMPCPTTMVVLSIMALNYPKTNKTLFNLLTIYAIVIGTATVMSGWLPDIPFVVLGIYCWILILKNKRINSKI